jgi:N-6 DNA Methylase
MNRNKVKSYAPQARRDFIRAVTDRAALYGLTKEKTEPVIERGDVAVIGGRPYPRIVVTLHRRLEERVNHEGFDNVMEAIAYTWFNRLVAIRYMELHEYLDHGFRVLSHPEGRNTPQILEHAEEVDLPGLKRESVIELKLAGNREAELYRKLLIAQCNALHDAMPFLFERIDDETELLLPDNLLQTDSIVRTLVAGIDEKDWQEVEIIGWLYEAYISERYEAVIGSVVASADIPAATQRFTPKWIVRYLVQNTLGRLWLATYPQSPLNGQMKYYVEPAEQSPEVQEQLRAITPTSLNPEDITFLDPACGSAHILVEAYDVFKAIYQERGYRAKDIPRLILTKNLFGLEIDDRAAQLAAFALMMKARADDRRLFDQKAKPNIRSLIQTDEMDAEDIAAALNLTASTGTPPPGHLFETEDNLFTRAASATSGQYISLTDVKSLVDLFEHAKTFGSLIQVLPALAARQPQIEQRCREVAQQTSEIASGTAAKFLPVIVQARMLAGGYDCVVANPPYMGSKYYNSALKEFVNKYYKHAKADLYACFIQRIAAFARPSGFVGMITIPNWMFLSSFEEVRKSHLAHQTIDTFIHNGRGVFGSDFGSSSFVLRNRKVQNFRGIYKRLFDSPGTVSTNEELERRLTSYPSILANSDEFQKIPGNPIAYWASSQVVRLFAENPPLAEVAPPRQGLATSDNTRFLRRWYEIAFPKVGFGFKSRSEAAASDKKWVPYDKGGDYKKWYGNNEFVINWENDGYEVIQLATELYGSPTKRVANLRHYFESGITYTNISPEPSVIYNPTG